LTPIFQAFLSRHVDGIIGRFLKSGKTMPGSRSNHLDLEIPLVYITMEPQKDISVVAIDNYLGGRMAVSHLLEQGYRKIGHISGPLDWWEDTPKNGSLEGCH
jgi:DNA-binding LacI/PurR family transcriptional regulator